MGRDPIYGEFETLAGAPQEVLNEGQKEQEAINQSNAECLPRQSEAQEAWGRSPLKMAPLKDIPPVNSDNHNDPNSVKEKY